MHVQLLVSMFLLTDWLSLRVNYTMYNFSISELPLQKTVTENVLDRMIMQLCLQCKYIGIKAYNTIFKKNRGNIVTNAICMNIIKYMVLLTYVSNY